MEDADPADGIEGESHSDPTPGREAQSTLGLEHPRGARPRVQASGLTRGGSGEGWGQPWASSRASWVRERTPSLA